MILPGFAQKPVVQRIQKGHLMKARLKTLWDIVRQSLQAWSDDNASQVAAAIAYYTIFSIPPLLIITMAITGSLFNSDIAQSQVIAQIGGVTGPQTAEFVRSLLENSTQSSNSPLASLISIVVLLAGASGLFFQIQSALNLIWDVPEKQTRSFRHTLRTHFLSYLMVLTIGFLLLIFLILSAVVSILIGYMNGNTQNIFLAEVTNFLVLYVTITILFSFIYRVIPDKEISWTDVWLGSAVTALLFMLGRYAIGFVLSLGQTTTAFGTAGSLIVLLLWIYYSAQIFLLGAEFTHLYSKKFGSRKKTEANKDPLPDKAPVQAELTPKK
jgi:membrane protein